MKPNCLPLFAGLLLLQADGPRKFAPTLPTLVKEGFFRANAGPSQAAVLPDWTQYRNFNDDPERLPLVTRALSQPLEMPSMGLEILGEAAAAKATLGDRIRALRGWAGEEKKDAASPAPASYAEGEEDAALVQAFCDLEIEGGRLPDDAFREQMTAKIASIPRALRRPMVELLAAMLHASKAFSDSLAALAPEDREFLLAKGLEFQHPDKEETAEEQLRTARLYREKFLRPELSESAERLGRAVDALLAAAAAPAIVKPSAILFEHETPLGWAIVGGKGKNQHDKDAALLVDLGGDDSYRNNAGGSSGVPGRIAVLVDLEGNDKYESKKDGAQGAGILGVGILVDLKGDDAYSAGNYSQGCGQFGFGLLLDRAGNDRYEAGGIVQGAGQFGFGLLDDEAGDDQYKAAICAQGFGGAGGVGALVDRTGKDQYSAGGKYPDTAREKTKFLSLSQGFGYGSRLARQEEGGGVTLVGSIPGGVGILADSGGDDVYDCQVFGQGSAYWFALGMLLDESGNDVYKAWRYAQGAGTHLAAGLLADLWGKDSYTSWGVSQGCGHDYAAAILFDYIGDDSYKAETLSQGVANARGAFGLLLDRDGADSYAYTGKDKNCWGAVSPSEFKAEDMPKSYGFFYDLAGKDAYKGPRAMKDATELPDENFGLGVGVDRP